MTLRIATLNLWGTRGDWQARRRVLREGFAALGADVLCFQEAIATSDYDQTTDVLGCDYEVVRQRVPEPDGQGISLASRWRIRRHREVDLHVTGRTGDFACTTLLAWIDAPSPFGSLLVANHLPSWQLDFERERELQALAAARALEEELARAGEGHAVVAGDLDADPGAASIRFFTGRQSLEGMSVCYRDAWASTHPGEEGATFTPDNPLHADWDWPFRRIDYVLVRCGGHGGPTLPIVSCERTFAAPDRGGVWASDHFGLVVDLDAPPEAGGDRSDGP